jgi:phosphoribosylformylglycinamidine synthase
MFGVMESASAAPARVDPGAMPAAARRVASLIADGLVLSAHDVSDGGVACAVAEMLIGGSTHERPIGAQIRPLGHDVRALFSEGPGSYVLEVRREDVEAVTGSAGARAAVIGETTGTGTLEFDHETVGVDELAMAWRGTLDW